MRTLSLHPHRDDILAARAAAEAAPLPAAPAPKPPNWGRDMIAFLRVEAPAVPAADHHRYDPDRLLPRHAVVRRVTPARVVLDDIDTVTADVAAALAARPELRHNAAVLMALAPVVAMLKEADVPETTHAERWAAQHRMNNAVDVLGIGDVVITYDPDHPYIGIQGTVTAVDGTAATVQFTDHDIRTLPASELVLSVRVSAMPKGVEL